MRKYHLKDDPFPGMTIAVHNDKDCIFCKHCECIWDYTNGPYVFFCDLDKPQCSEAKTSEEHTCEEFEESEEQHESTKDKLDSV